MGWLKRIKRIRTADYVYTGPKDLLAAVREQGLEGTIGKQGQPLSTGKMKRRLDQVSRYFPGPHGFGFADRRPL